MNPYYQDNHITLYHADCRDILPTLEQGFFCWTDPPYNVGKDYGVWNDSLPDGEYLEFCVDWIDELKRLCPEAGMCVYTPNKYLLDYWNLFGKVFRQIILTWSPEGAIRRKFINQHAILLTNASPQTRLKDVWHNLQIQGLGWFFKEHDFDHPGYTSEHLTKRVLAGLAPSQATILDPFSGTGTTLRCAKDFNRKAIGIEINERYCEIAVKRLAQEPLPLEFPKVV